MDTVDVMMVTTDITAQIPIAIGLRTTMALVMEPVMVLAMVQMPAIVTIVTLTRTVTTGDTASVTPDTMAMTAR